MAAVAVTSPHRPAPPVPAGHRLLGLGSLLLAAAHLLILVLMPHSTAWGVMLLAMTIWCVKCAWCVLRGGPPQALLAMSALMGLAHVVMVIGMPWFAGHHAGPAHSGQHHATVMLLVAAAEFAVMFGAAFAIRAGHRRFPATCARE